MADEFDETEHAPGPPEAPDSAERRDFLKRASVAAAALAIGCGGDDDAPRGADAGGSPVDGGRTDADGSPADGGGTDAGAPVDGGPVLIPETVMESAFFGLSVASGDVTSDRAILWTRYDGAMALRLVVWEMMGDTYTRTVHDEPVTPADGGFAHEDVLLPAPGARYRYAFFEHDGAAPVARSAIGRFRAAIAETDMSTVTLGAVSCTRNGRTFRTIGAAATRDDLDVFLYLGDTTYNDGASSVAEYRAKWVENLGTDEYRALRASVSALATWDDHEIINDFDPETLDPAQHAAARQVFHENQPLRPNGASPGRIWKSMRWGRTVEIFVLDCRSERRPSTRTSGSPIYISREQMTWLTAGLLNSQAVFKVLMNSVPITDFPGAFDLASRGDRWEGYAAQREEILRFIDDNAITGVLWVAGDFHMASMGRVSTSGYGASQVEVLVGPGAQFGNPLAATLGGPQFDWTSSRNNYTVLELDPATSQVRVWYRDGDDSVLETRTYAL